MVTLRVSSSLMRRTKTFTSHRESFLPITVISGNLVNAGTYDASTNLLSSVTTAGSAAGFTNGQALPAPAAGNLNYYVVVDTSGTGSGNAPAVALAPPDMLLSRLARDQRSS